MLETGFNTGLTIAFNAGLYYANSKLFDVGNPKAAAIYSVSNAIVSTIVFSTTLIGVSTLFSDPSKIDGTNPVPALLLGAVLLTTTAAMAVTAGIVSGIFGGKKACEWSGNPITAKQIVALALIYNVESAVIGRVIGAGRA